MNTSNNSIQPPKRHTFITKNNFPNSIFYVNKSKKKPADKRNLISQFFPKRSASTKMTSKNPLTTADILHQTNLYKKRPSLLKTTTFSTTLHKQRTYTEFFINNNSKNKLYKYKSNEIITTKYTFYTIFPCVLLLELCKMSNVYFLICIIVQIIAKLNDLTPYTAVLPFIALLLFAVVKELSKEQLRKVNDNEINKQKVLVYRNNKFICVNSKDVEIGEIVLVRDNEKCPCHLILIDTAIPEGMCYVDTCWLDGEENLIQKESKEVSKGMILKIIEDGDVTTLKDFIIEGKVQMNIKDMNFDKPDGKCLISYHEKQGVKDHIAFQIGEEQLIQRGSILKHTAWIIGIAVIVNNNNGGIVNNINNSGTDVSVLTQQRCSCLQFKSSFIEKQRNFYFIVLFVLMLILSVVCIVYYDLSYKTYGVFYKTYLHMTKALHDDNKPFMFVKFMLTFNTFIPISLCVTIEICQLIQCMYIKWDVSLYPTNNSQSLIKVNNPNIISDLGKVNFIFTDKSTTLTTGEWLIKYCFIGHNCYEYCNNDIEIPGCTNTMNNCTCDAEKKIICSFVSEKPEPLRFGPGYFDNFFNSADFKHSISKHEKELIRKYWLALALLHKYEHSVNDTRKLDHYGAYSYDITLQHIAKEQGFYSLHTPGANKTQKTLRAGNKTISCKILHEFEYLPRLKRMGFIIKDEQGLIMLYMKGSDSEIKKRLSPVFLKDFRNQSTFILLDKYAKQGYKVIMFAYKILTHGVYKEWAEKEKKQDVSKMNWILNSNVYKVVDNIEQNLSFLGAIVLRDKLQPKVGESLKNMCDAGIRPWILTNDSIGNTSRVARMVKLITNEEKVFKIKSTSHAVFIRKQTTLKKYGSESCLGDPFVNSCCGDNFNTGHIHIPEFEHFLRDYELYQNPQYDDNSSSLFMMNYGGANTGTNINNNNNNGHNCFPNSTISAFKGNNFIFKGNININTHINNINNINNNYNNTNIIPSATNIHAFSTHIHTYNTNLNINNAAETILSEQPNSKLNNNIPSVISNSLLPRQVINKTALRPYILFIESSILGKVFSSTELTAQFFDIAITAKAVIVSYLTPLQKGLVIKKLKQHQPKAVTLSIGEGEKDHHMLSMSNIAVGVVSSQQVSVPLNNDFVIGEFRHLDRMLLFYGRNTYRREGRFVLFFIYKNIVFTFINFIFACASLHSGMPVYDGTWFALMYNVIFTTIPLVVQTISDFYFNEQNANVKSKDYCELYKMQNNVSRLQSVYIPFIIVIVKSFITAFVIFIFVFRVNYINAVDEQGNTNTFHASSCLISTSLVVSLNVAVIIRQQEITLFFVVSVGCTAVLYFLFIVLSHRAFQFEMYMTLIDFYAKPRAMLVLLLNTGVVGIIEYALKVLRRVISAEGAWEVLHPPVTANTNTNTTGEGRKIPNVPKMVFNVVENPNNNNNSNNVKESELGMLWDANKKELNEIKEYNEIMSEHNNPTVVKRKEPKSSKSNYVLRRSDKNRIAEMYQMGTMIRNHNSNNASAKKKNKTLILISAKDN